MELNARASRLGKKTIECRGVTKGFGGRTVVRDFDCMLLRDDRIGIVGANGSGKSTLLNLLAGELAPDAGAVETGETVRVGYFRQEVPDMDGDTRVIDYVKEIGNRIETGEGMLTASQLLEQFLFPAEAQWSPIRKLSGGEKRRLFLLSVLAAAPNVLLLDEPTNDLDIQTLSVLEDYLDSFPGAVVAVSHDRYFLDRVVRRVFAVEGDGSVRGYPGGYTEYLEARRAAGQPAARSPKPAEPKAARPQGAKKLKFSYKEQREFETIDADIAALEAELAQVQAEQEEKATDYVALQSLQERQAELEAALEEKNGALGLPQRSGGADFQSVGGAGRARHSESRFTRPNSKERPHDKILETPVGNCTHLRAGAGGAGTGGAVSRGGGPSEAGGRVPGCLGGHGVPPGLPQSGYYRSGGPQAGRRRDFTGVRGHGHERRDSPGAALRRRPLSLRAVPVEQIPDRHPGNRPEKRL